MKCNINTRVSGKKIVLVPYEKKHVSRYNEWMQNEEIQDITSSEPLSLEEEYDLQQSGRNDENNCTFIILNNLGLEDTEKSELDNMIGDVNLFFNDEDDPSAAEIEILIAEPAARGKGMGKEALYSMMRYGIETLNVARFTANVGYTNEPALKMFSKLGFKEYDHDDDEEEMIYLFKVAEDSMKRIVNETPNYEVGAYGDPDPDP